jgi:hypothetical protein
LYYKQLQISKTRHKKAENSKATGLALIYMFLTAKHLKSESSYSLSDHNNLCSRKTAANSRISGQQPPLYAFLDTIALASAVFAPRQYNQGCRCFMAFD